jgi:8-oxo-dGTP pyrophosphatase MutT (NUDIX family)
MDNKICLNCGENGHILKHCKQSKTSYGIICVNIADAPYIIDDIEHIFINSYKDMIIISKKYPDMKIIKSNIIDEQIRNISYNINTKFIQMNSRQQSTFSYYKNKILFNVVSRKISHGFDSFIRGKYNINNPKSISSLFHQMYAHEIDMLKPINNIFPDYNDLLYYYSKKYLDKTDTLNKVYNGKHCNTYFEAKNKYEILCGKIDYSQNTNLIHLCTYIEGNKTHLNSLEWGFPKGRLSHKDNNILDCAIREYEEETGYKESDYKILDSMLPINEHLTGTDGRKYNHVYYMAITKNINLPEIKDKREIDSVEWISYDEAMMRFRTYHTEKKQILTYIYLFIMDYIIRKLIC